jgi:hypothetical protein
MNAEKISYCDDIMCCLTIHDFSKEDAGLYTCFMYVDVFKAEVLIPQPPGHSCNRGGLNLRSQKIEWNRIKYNRNRTGIEWNAIQ